MTQSVENDAGLCRLLLDAAALMRQRAEAASDGPWEALALGSEGYAVLAERPAEDRRRSRLRVARLGWEDWDTDRANAEHIASWPPAVAVAVADWLDAEADAVEGLASSLSDYALAVARAYLGERP
jgi:hypothetical protein